MSSQVGHQGKVLPPEGAQAQEEARRGWAQPQMGEFTERLDHALSPGV